MKKILLILLCLPFIGFGQHDCGKEPIDPLIFSKTLNKNSKEYKKYLQDLAQFKECIAEYRIKLGPIKAKSKLNNNWIYDNTLFYEIIYEKDLNIKEGHIDIKIRKFRWGKNSYLKGAKIKVQKKDGRTRVLVYDFEMGTDQSYGGSRFGGSVKEKTYNFPELVFNINEHKFKKSITSPTFERVERGIVEGVENKRGLSDNLLNDDW